jgi:gluconate 5-dehydrogenase
VAKNDKAAFTRIEQGHTPQDGATHRYGLAPDRWARLGLGAFWITGGGTGYGQAIAVALAQAGGRAVISGQRSEKLEETIRLASELGGKTGSVTAVAVDLTEPTENESAAVQVSKILERPTGIVHCAALPQPAAGPWPLLDMDPIQWDRLMATNVRAGWLAGRALLPAMAASGQARIVFFTSAAGWHDTPGVGPYNISKASVNSLGASLAAEAAARYPEVDIQINVLDPGEARTEMNQGSDASPYSIVPMALLLLSHPPGGPNGRFFFRDGRHLSFAAMGPYGLPLTDAADHARSWASRTRDWLRRRDGND